MSLIISFEGFTVSHQTSLFEVYLTEVNSYQTDSRYRLDLVLELVHMVTTMIYAHAINQGGKDGKVWHIFRFGFWHYQYMQFFKMVKKCIFKL